MLVKATSRRAWEGVEIRRVEEIELPSRLCHSAARRYFGGWWGGRRTVHGEASAEYHAAIARFDPISPRYAFFSRRAKHPHFTAPSNQTRARWHVTVIAVTGSFS